jgi:predicted nuclease of predicted toxin-antitoxin system
MKMLCDVHIPYKLVNFLRSQGIEAVHVNRILAKWYTKDSDICQYADDNDYVVVTKDVDFRNSHFVKGRPRKLLRVNLGNIPNQELIQIVGDNLKVLTENFATGKCYVEINRHQMMLVRDTQFFARVD